MNGVIGYVQTRYEKPGVPRAFFAEANVRPVEPINFTDAPDPVRSSDFNDRPAKMPKVVYTNIPGILAVMQDEFGWNLWAPDNPGAHVYQAMGGGGYPSGREPDVERVNVQDPQPIAFGSQYIMPSSSDHVLFPMGEL